MKPLNSFKKWLLNILVPYIEGTNKKKKDKKWVWYSLELLLKYFCL